MVINERQCRKDMLGILGNIIVSQSDSHNRMSVTKSKSCIENHCGTKKLEILYTPRHRREQNSAKNYQCRHHRKSHLHSGCFIRNFLVLPGVSSKRNSGYRAAVCLVELKAVFERKQFFQYSQTQLNLFCTCCKVVLPSSNPECLVMVH